MIKNNYYSSNETVETQGPKNDLVDKETATEVGSRGYNLTEMTTEFDSSEPKDINGESQENKLSNPVFNLLISLGDELDKNNEEALASFADFLIKKFAKSEDEVDYSVMFNDLIIKINNADLVNTNEIIKKLTKIYSRTFLLEYYKNQDRHKSKKSAYKKMLHRADQYLSETK